MTPVASPSGPSSASNQSESARSQAPGPDISRSPGNFINTVALARCPSKYRKEELFQQFARHRKPLKRLQFYRLFKP
jgi:hypothetical protein